MCSSERSLQLLKQHIQDRDDKIADGVRLALARRGDKKWEEFYIKEFLLQEEKVKEFSLDWAWEKSFTDALFNLEYIGSVECIMVLFDSIVRYSGEIERNMKSRIKNMVAFLEGTGMKVPGGDNKAELDKWWRENRANVERVLREKADRLPRLPITPILLGGS